MPTDDIAALREKRHNQLREMWKDRRGQHAVLSLFHGALPTGEVARAGMSVFDVILDNEFREPSLENELDGDDG